MKDGKRAKLRSARAGLVSAGSLLATALRATPGRWAADCMSWLGKFGDSSAGDHRAGMAKRSWDIEGCELGSYHADPGPYAGPVLAVCLPIVINLPPVAVGGEGDHRCHQSPRCRSTRGIRHCIPISPNPNDPSLAVQRRRLSGKRPGLCANRAMCRSTRLAARDAAQVATSRLDNCFTGWDGSATILAGAASLRIEASEAFRQVQVFTPRGRISSRRAGIACA